VHQSLDRNWGACTISTCKVKHAPRCDAFMCLACCQSFHMSWPKHMMPNGVIVNPERSYPGVSQLPVHYGGTDTKRPEPEWDYDHHPPNPGEITELDDSRTFIPLSNYRAGRTEWPVDYVP